jgi:ribonuclease HI
MQLASKRLVTTKIDKETQKTRNNVSKIDRTHSKSEVLKLGRSRNEDTKLDRARNYALKVDRTQLEEEVLKLETTRNEVKKLNQSTTNLSKFSGNETKKYEHETEEKDGLADYHERSKKLLKNEDSAYESGHEFDDYDTNEKIRNQKCRMVTIQHPILKTNNKNDKTRNNVLKIDRTHSISEVLKLGRSRNEDMKLDRARNYALKLDRTQHEEEVLKLEKTRNEVKKLNQSGINLSKLDQNEEQKTENLENSPGHSDADEPGDSRNQEEEINNNSHNSWNEDEDENDQEDYEESLPSDTNNDEVEGNTADEDITIMQWNINGYYAHFEDLKLLLSEKNPVAVCLQETNLKLRQEPKIGSYKSYTKSVDAQKAKHGVAILIRNDVNSEEILLDTNLNAVAARVSLTRDITICSIYIPPRETVTEEQLTRLYEQLPKPAIITGDVNAKSPRWGSPNTCSRGKIIEKFSDKHDLNVINTGENTHVTHSTGTESALDVTIASATLDGELDWYVHGDLCGSDHYPTLIRLLDRFQELTRRPMWRIKSANWEKFKTRTQMEIENNEIHDVESFTTMIIDCAKESIRKSSPKIPKKRVPWWTPAIQDLIRERRRAERRHHSNPTEGTLIAFRQARAKARYCMKKARRETWKNYVDEIRVDTPPKKVWGKIRAISGKNDRKMIRTLKKRDENLTTNRKEITQLLADQFQATSHDSNYSTDFIERKAKEELQIIIPELGQGEEYNLPFSEAEMDNALSTSKGSSPGPDDVHYEMLKQLPRVAKLKLLEIYNKIWEGDEFPESWTEATVIPILKPGKDPNQTNSYRPISLTSCVCKTLEKMVNYRLTHELEKAKRLPAEQYGFRRGRSTEDVHVILEAEAQEAFREKQHLILVSLDLEKAYDTCWRYHIVRTLHKWRFRGHMLHFVKNFTKDRTFKVAIGNTKSEKMSIDNGVVQGAVLSVTLFLVAISEMANKVRKPRNDQPGTSRSQTILSRRLDEEEIQEVGILGYADDWVLYTRDHQMLKAQNNIQAALNRVSEWCGANGFKISQEKTKAMHICRLRSRPENHSDPTIRLNGQTLEVVNTHKILGLTLDSQLTWRPHIENLKAKCSKRLNILKHLAGTQWGADQSTLIRVHKMLVLSAMEFGSAAYGSARNTQLKKLDPTHNNGLRIALGAFCINRTQNLLIEAGEATLQQRREKKVANMVVKIMAKPEHPINRYLRNKKIYDQYGQRSSLTCPFFIRAKEACFQLEVDLKDVDQTVQPEYTPWITNMDSNIDTTLLALPKGSSTLRIRAELETTLNANYPNYTQIYTDGSKMEGNVGCAVVTPTEIREIRLQSPFSIFNAEAEAINTAINMTRTFEQSKRVILSDSLSCLTALNGMKKIDNPKVMKMMNQIHRENAHLILMWVPGHAGILGNEKADQHAKAALKGEIDRTHKTVPDDWKNWINKKQHERRQAEWATSENSMVTLKPEIKRNNNTQTLTRREQVIVSRLRMGYTRLTHGHRVDLEPPPECGDCGCRLTVNHILWECQTFQRKRTECNLSIETFSGGVDEIHKLIEYTRKIGVYHDI